MKINGIEQVNIGTEEEAFWVPKDKPRYIIGFDPYKEDEGSIGVSYTPKGKF